MAAPDTSWIPYGPSAVLFRFPNSDPEHGKLEKITAALEKEPPEDVLEYVPGLSTLLFIFKASRNISLAEQAEAMSAWMENAAADPGTKPVLHEIPVCYDGPDLKALARHHGLSEEEIVAIHSGASYSVHMLGFSPGFPYLGPLDPRLHTPRLATPRSRIAPGSVAIGGPHTGIYTVESAGGWHLLGQTRTKIFDPSRSSPGREKDMFLLRPGDRVRFIPVHE